MACAFVCCFQNKFTILIYLKNCVRDLMIDKYPLKAIPG